MARQGDQWHTLGLWARDVNAQAALTPITLVGPVVAEPVDTAAPLDCAITVWDGDTQALERAVARARCVQLPGNASWRGARLTRQVLKFARRHDTPVFLGISSNRARTELLNSRHQGLPKRVRAWVRSLDIRFTQRWLARRCTGVFVVGAGLIPLVRGANANLHVGIASWINDDDIVHIRPAPTLSGAPALRICMAGRLEVMKGFHIGIAALAQLKQQLALQVTLIGSGPERERLVAQARDCALPGFTYLEPVAYPGPFFALLDRQDLVLLTNLNDEQPRLVFDALCRGAIPVCPDAPAYTALGLVPEVLYRQGDAQSLADCVLRLADPAVRQRVHAAMRDVLAQHTLHVMHTKRLAWMQASHT